MALGNAHNLGLAHAHDNKLGVGHSHDNNLTLGQSDIYDFGLHQSDDHDLALQQLHEHDQIRETELALDQNHSDSCDEHERQLELALSNHDLDLEGGHQFSVMSNHKFSVGCSTYSRNDILSVPAGYLSPDSPDAHTSN